MLFLMLSIPTILARFHTARDLGLIGLFLAIYFVIVTGKEKWQVHRTRQWSTAQGTIENLQLEKVSGGMNGVDYWKVRFHYRYNATGEHEGTYAFNCTSETQGQGAIAGLQNKTVCVHYKPGAEGKSVLWEDEMWDLWWDTYWKITHDDAPEQDSESVGATTPRG